MAEQSVSRDTLAIRQSLSIPLSELRYRFSRSSGPGGQNVNRTATRVELLFDVANSPSLTQHQRQAIERRLGNLIDHRGVLHLTSQSSASQLLNRQDVTVRFQSLLREALRPRRPRRPTRPTQASRERRLGQKRQRGELKRGRGRIRPEDTG